MSQPSPFASATQLARLVAKRDISARELLELYLARVKKLNPAINAVVVLNATAARKRAERNPVRRVLFSSFIIQ